MRALLFLLPLLSAEAEYLFTCSSATCSRASCSGRGYLGTGGNCNVVSSRALKTSSFSPYTVEIYTGGSVFNRCPGTANETHANVAVNTGCTRSDLMGCLTGLVQGLPLTPHSTYCNGMLRPLVTLTTPRSYRAYSMGSLCNIQAAPFMIEWK